METVRVDAHRKQPSPSATDLQADLERARYLARLFDTQFSIGGVKFGLDALIGLMPGVGDTAVALIGLYPIYLARKHGLGRLIIGRMIANVLIDWGFGAVPLLGDVFDVFYKSFLRNVELLESAALKRQEK